jgi:hypothetical protein
MILDELLNLKKFNSKLSKYTIIRWMTRRMTRGDTEETRLSESVRVKSDLGELRSQEIVIIMHSIEHRSRLSLGHREHKCLGNKGRERN